MITLTTVQPIIQFPSSILSESMTCNDRSLLISGSPIHHQSHSMMHPDNLLLHNHGVTSPRLSSTSSASSVTNTQFNKNNCDSPPLVSLRLKDTSHDSDRDDIIVPRSFSSSSDTNNRESFYTINNSNHIDNNHSEITTTSNHENIKNIISDDHMSCCSDDSELSVGQECCDNVNSSENNSNFQNCIKNMIDDDRNNQLNSNNSNSNNNNNVNNSSIISNKPVNEDSESIDNVSSLSDDNRITSIGDNLPSDEISDGSSPHRDIMNDSILMGTSSGIRIPTVPTIIRPSPTRLQEEFLKKSHLYAEEFMKQQMQFMAAARVSAFSLRHPSILPDFSKINFRPHLKQQIEINDNLLNLNGIHSHLSVISKLSSQLNNSESSIGNKLTGFCGIPRETSQSPPSLNQFHAHHAIHQHHPFMNNDLHETNLKFSIDNILKADFGRRITDPILKRNHCPLSANNTNKGYHSNSRKSSNKSVEHTVDNNKNAIPIDLTNISSHQQLNDTINLNLNTNCNNVNNSNNNSSSGSNNIATLSSINDNKNHQTHHISNKLLTGSLSTAINAVTTASQTSSSVSSVVSSSLTSTSAVAAAAVSTTLSSESGGNGSNSSSSSGGPMVWPAWVYCTRYSDRPSSGKLLKLI